MRITHRVVALGGLAALAALALAAAPGAGAGGSKASRVSVVGAGTIAIPQVSVLESPERARSG